MTKNGKRGYFVLAILFVVFSVISFVVPFSKKAPFWIAYVFGVIAIAYQIYVFSISFANGEDAKSKFYGFPIAKIGVTYLVLQLALSVAEMSLAFILPVWIPVVINIILLAFVLIGCIAADTMRDEIVRQDVQIKKDVSNMRALQSLSAALVGHCADETLKADLKKLAEDFRFSDPVSSDQTKDMERELDVMLKDLQKSLIDGDFSGVKAYCAKISNSLSERNRVCALSK